MNSVGESLRRRISLAASVLCRRLPSDVERCDLEQAGFLAAHQAYDRWDPEAGMSQENYALRRANGAMLDELRGMDPLSRADRRLRKRIDAAAAAQGSGRVDWAAVAQAVGASLDEVHRLRGLWTASGDETDADDARPDESPGPDESAYRLEQAAIVREELARLPEVQRIVMAAAMCGTPLADTAAQLGVSRSRVCQIQARAVRSLQRSVSMRLVDGRAIRCAVASPTNAQEACDITDLFSPDIVRGVGPELLTA